MNWARFINYNSEYGGASVPKDLATVAPNSMFYGEYWTNSPGGSINQFYGIKLCPSNNKDYGCFIGAFTGDDTLYFCKIVGKNLGTWKTISMT